MPAEPPTPERQQKSRPRYFRNDPNGVTRRDPYKQLVASLTRLVKEFPPDTIPAGGGLYYGPISIAYLFMALQPLYPDFTIEGYPMGTWSAVYLKQAQDYMKEYPGPSPTKCGVSDDIMALLAIGAASAKDADMAAALCDYADVTTDDEASPEWLYGQSGYLYLLRMVRASFSDDRKIKDLIDDTSDEIIETILDAPRPWKWHGKAYVGAVHGLFGIITQIVLTNHKYAPRLEADLSVGLSYQYESGNFPSTIPPGRDKLVQVCHGAPGVVQSLLSIRHYFPNLRDKIDGAIRRGRACIKERGLLTKEPCLCHGISGNALCLENEDFEQFLTYTTGHEMKAMEKDGMIERSNDPSSLWCGEAGRAWAWAVADKDLDKRLIGGVSAGHVPMFRPPNFRQVPESKLPDRRNVRRNARNAEM